MGYARRKGRGVLVKVIPLVGVALRLQELCHVGENVLGEFFANIRGNMILFKRIRNSNSQSVDF